MSHPDDTDAPVLAIDGPSGAGKGTIARLTAARLGWHLLDSGALYRVVAMAAAEQDLDLDDEAALASLAHELDVAFVPGADDVQVMVAGRDVTLSLREEATGAAASRIAPMQTLRNALLTRQRAFLQQPGLVADGRDMGTVVFPAAELKIFLTASPAERARRRYKQLKDKGIGVSLPALSREIEARDRRDAERSVAPLKAASDARVLDTTDLEIEKVAEQVLAWAAVTWPHIGL